VTLPGRPLARLTFLFGAGFLALTAFAWLAAATGLRLPFGLYVDERELMGLGFVLAFAAAWMAGPLRPLQAALAAAAATAVHMIVYYLPLAILLELPMTRYAAADLGTNAGWLFVGYTVALAAALVIRGLRKTGDVA
jgi:hypothetical protein